MIKKKVAVIGSRTFNDYFRLKEKLDQFDIGLIVSGGAKGADKLAELCAKNHTIETLIFKPDWEVYGKRAGYMRNIDIIDSCDLVIAFWDGISAGTNHSIEYARKTNKEVIIYDF